MAENGSTAKMSPGTREPKASTVKHPNVKPTKTADTKESGMQVDDVRSAGTSRESKDHPATTENQPVSHTANPVKDANTEDSQGQDDSSQTTDIRSVKTLENDFKPYLKVSLENKELLNKLKWNQDENTRWRSPHFKGNKSAQERLKKCFIELEQENGFENIRIAWEGSDDFRSYEPSIRPESSGETLDSRDISQPQCIFRGLLLNTKYTVTVALKSAGEKKDKEVHIVFHTDAEKVRNEEIQKLGTVKGLLTNINPPTCNVKWRTPEIEKLDKDYVLDAFRLEWKDQQDQQKDQQENVPLHAEDSYNLLINLPPGRKYTIRVVAIYKDRDCDSLHEAVSETEIHPEILVPKLRTTYKDDRINFAWNTVNGASSYKIRVTDAKDETKTLFEKETSETLMYISIGPEIDYGKRCKFTLTAVDVSGKETAAEPTEETIGGPGFPYSITLQTNKENPRRSLQLKWLIENSSTTKIPHVQLHEKGNDTPVHRVEPDERGALFDQLKSSTTYYARIAVKATGSPIILCSSNEVKTEKAKQRPAKQHLERSDPAEVWEEKGKDATEAIIKWSDVDLGEGYKTRKYHVEVVRISWMNTFRAINPFETALVMTDITTPNENKVLVSQIKPNNMYRATVKTTVWNIDEEKETELGERTLDFYGPNYNPKLQEIEYDGKFAVFCWDSITADKLVLEIKDASSEKVLLQKDVRNSSKVKIPMEGDLRVGRTCAVRLVVSTSKGNIDSEWISWVIGGDKVPRDVTVIKNCDNPRRRLDIHFKEPERSPKPTEYEIETCPSEGRSKKEKTSKTDYTFKHLRSAMSYTIHVIAFYKNGDKSTASVSDSFTTDPCPATFSGPPINDMTHASHSQLIFSGKVQSTYHMHHGKIDDEVEDVDVKPVDDSKEDKDVVKLVWKQPSFSNNRENYVVNYYQWRVRDGVTNSRINDGQICSHEGQTAFETGNISLSLGKSYRLEITTNYEDIDEDNPKKTSKAWRGNFNARPEKPENITCLCDYKAEIIIVNWNASGEDTNYHINIINCENQKPIGSVKEEAKSNATFKFEQIGYGIECYAQVAAVRQGKWHIAKSDNVIIGGDTVPRAARAETELDTPTTAARVTWSTPPKAPKGYLVQVIDADSRELDNKIPEADFKAEDLGGTIRNLKPGTKYFFKVFAIYEEQRSAGCKTNIIHTKAGPEKIRNFTANSYVKDKSRSIEAKWDKEIKCTKYILVVEDESRQTRREILTKDTRCLVDGLCPRTNYKLMVAGGNKNGFGNYSIPEFIVTKSGRTCHVRLDHDRDTPEEPVLDLVFEGTGESNVEYLATVYEGGKEFRTKLSKNTSMRFDDLSPNKKYHAKVQVQYINNLERGEGVLSNEIFTAPPCPENLDAKLKIVSRIAEDVIELKWNTQSGCNTHRVSIRRGAKFEAPRIVKGKPEYEYECPDGTSDYSFTVQSMNASGIFSPPTAEQVIKLAPRKIGEVVASLKENEDMIEVKWEKNDNKTTSFLIEIVVDGKRKRENKEFRTQWEIKAKHYKEYRFRIYPQGETDLLGHFTESNVVQSRPQHVRLITATPFQDTPSTSMLIEWQDLEISDVKYELEIRSFESDKAEPLLTFRGETSHVIVFKFSGGKYVVRVRATRNGVVGLWSKEKICQLAPSTVQNVCAETKRRPSGENIIEVTWQPLEGHVAEYMTQMRSVTGKEYCSPNQKCTNLDANGRMRAEFFGFPVGRDYVCDVYALIGNLQGKSASSNPVSAGWERPADFSITLDENDPTHKATITWTNPSCVEVFELSILESSGKEWKEGSLIEPRYVFHNGRPGETYEFTLRWGSEQGFDRDYIKKNIRFAPGPPTMVTVACSLGNEMPKLNVSVGYRNAKPDYFKVRLKEEATDEIIHEQTSASGELSFDGVKHGEVYIVSARAMINDLEEFQSEEIRSAPVQIGPGKIKNFTANHHVNDKSRSIEAKWDQERKCTKYLLVVMDEVRHTRQEILTNYTNYLVGGLFPRTMYKLMVAAGNENGFGNYSNPVVVSTDKGRPSHVVLAHDKNTPEVAALKVVFEGSGESNIEYLATLYEGEKKVRKKTSKSTSMRFDNLLPNKKYQAKVHVQYMDNRENGEGVFSDKIYTAPPCPENLEAKLKIVDGIAMDVVKLKWNAESGCNIHRVNIRRGTKVEESRIVDGMQEYEYECSDVTSDYSFTIQSKNASGIFSAPSVEKVLKLAPRKIRKVIASLKEDEDIIEVKWEKNDETTTSYFIKTIVDDELQTEGKVVPTRCLIEAKHNKKYLFRIYPQGEADLLGQFTESNAVQSRPQHIRLITATRFHDSPSTSMRVHWEDVAITDIEYELKFTPLESDKVEPLLTIRGKASHVYACNFPGEKYEVRIRAKRNGVVGLWSKAKICQLAPIAVKDVRAELKQRPSGEKIIEVSWTPLKEHVTRYIAGLRNVTGKEYRSPAHKSAEKANGRIRAEFFGFPLGRDYKCDVYALVDNLQGEIESSNTVSTGWERPTDFSIYLDEYDPTHKATITWNKPSCVEVCELAILDSTGEERKEGSLIEPRYEMKIGRPGETCELTLRWGSKQELDQACMRKSFRYAPGPPILVSAASSVEKEKPKLNVSIKYQNVRPDYFNVRVKEEATGEIILTQKSASDIFSFDGVKHGEVYLVSARAVINGLEKYPSEEIWSAPVQIVPKKIEIFTASPHVNDKTRSIEAKWEQEIKCTKYLLIVEDEIHQTRRKIQIKDTRYIVDGLCPRTMYNLVVAGGNESGFGNYSDPVVVFTDKGRPSHVVLSHDKNTPEAASLETVFEGSGESDVEYLATLHEGDKEVCTKTSKETSMRFNNLSLNTKYHAKVQVQYLDTNEKGEGVFSNEIYTAPPCPDNLEGKLKIVDGIAEDVIKLKWNATSGCNTHRVNIRRGANIEACRIVKGKQEYEYQCPDGTSDCSFTIQSKNASGIFSPTSVEQVVKLAPRKISKVIASLKEGEDIIEVKWERNDDKTIRYTITTIVDGELKKTDEVFSTHCEIKAKHNRVYLFRIHPRDETDVIGQLTESNVVQSRPNHVRLISATPCHKSACTSILVTWENLTISDVEYDLKLISLENKKPEPLLTFRGLTSHVHACKFPGGKYEVSIRAKRNGVVGLWSKAQICQLAPVAVKDVRAEMKQGQTGEKIIEVTWQPLEDHVTGYMTGVRSVTGEEYRSPDQNSTVVASNGKMTAEISGFPLGRDYVCEVYAVNDKLRGQPASSNTVFAGWERPTDFSIILDEVDPTHKATITWNRPGCVEVFELSILESSGIERKKGPLTEPRYEIKNGRPGEMYELTLRWGSRQELDQDCIKKSLRFAPGPPTMVCAASVLEMDSPKLHVSIKYQNAKPDYFKVRVKEEATGEIIHEKNSETDEMAFGGVKHGEVYIVSAQAVNKNLEQFSSEEIWSAPVQIVPGKIEGVDITEENGTVVVTWPDSTPRVEEYQVKFARGSQAWEPESPPVPGAKFELTTKGIGEEYTFSVAGKNRSGVGVYSEDSVYATVPSAPSNVCLKLNENNPETCLVVTYDDKHRDPQKKYEVTVNDGKGVLTGDLKYLITGLNPGEKYNVTVCSVVGLRNSAAVSAFEPIFTIPGEVLNIRCKSTDDGLLFEWDHPSEIAPKHYDVKWKRDDSPLRSEVQRTPNFLIRNPAEKTSYRIRVAAINDSGTGTFSKWATSLTPPPPPYNVTATAKLSNYGKRTLEIAFDDELNPRKKYLITLVGKEGQKTFETEKSPFIADGLKPGSNYKVFVCTKLGHVISTAVEASYKRSTR